MPRNFDPADEPQEKIINDDTAKFSDRCLNCKHTRADHLSPGVQTPVAGQICSTLVCSIEGGPQRDKNNNVVRIEGKVSYPTGHRHSDKDCNLQPCACKGWVN